MARKVTAPDGTAWRVGRRWVGKRLRLRRKKKDGEGGDLSSWDFVDFGDAGGLIAGIFVVIFVVVLFLAVWPIIAIAIELVVLLLLFLFGLMGRVVFRRPWTIHATGPRKVHEWKVVGWRASRRRIDEVAAAVGQGMPLPPGDVAAQAERPKAD